MSSHDSVSWVARDRFCIDDLVMMLSLFFYVVIHECVAPCYVVHLFAHMLPVTDSVVSIRCQLTDVTAYSDALLL